MSNGDAASFEDAPAVAFSKWWAIAGRFVVLALPVPMLIVAGLSLGFDAIWLVMSAGALAIALSAGLGRWIITEDSFIPPGDMATTFARAVYFVGVCAVGWLMFTSHFVSPESNFILMVLHPGIILALWSAAIVILTLVIFDSESKVWVWTLRASWIVVWVVSAWMVGLLVGDLFVLLGGWAILPVVVVAVGATAFLTDRGMNAAIAWEEQQKREHFGKQ